MGAKKKSIEYANESWNPFSGCLTEDCAVKERLEKCWAERMAYRLRGRYGYDLKEPFKPTFHNIKELEKPLHWIKPRRIATCFMGDVAFAEPRHLVTILNIMRITPQHRFYILTKKPRNLVKYNFPKNCLVGVTVNRNQDFYRVTDLLFIKAELKFISFEPIYEEIDLLLQPTILDGINWIIIGAQTKPEFQPKKEWIDIIVNAAKAKNIPVFMKDNLKYEPKTYDLPKGMHVCQVIVKS